MHAHLSEPVRVSNHEPQDQHNASVGFSEFSYLSDLQLSWLANGESESDCLGCSDC